MRTHKKAARKKASAPRTPKATPLKTLKTPLEIVEVLGGHASVCKLLRTNRKASYYWTGTAGAFPARGHAMMTELLEKKGYKASPALWSQTGYEQEAA